MSKSRKHTHIRDKLRAIYFAKTGNSISQIAVALDISTTSVKRWVKQYNDHSLNGLCYKKRKSRTIRLSEDNREKFTQRICIGPTKKDKVKSFTLLDIQEILAEEYQVTYSTFAISDLLKKLKISYTKPRPLHPKADKELQRKWLQKDLPFF